MRILVHEYVGHPFAFQLSDELARRGHQVLHIYSSQFPSPKAVPGRPGGAATVEAVSLPGEFRKHDYLSRRRFDIRHGRFVAARIATFRPDVVISSTTPLDAQRFIQAAAKRHGARFVYWLQDIYSVGIAATLGSRFLGLGRLVARVYARLERRLLRRSDVVVAICPEFAALCHDWGVSPARCQIIENWAPLDELAPRSAPDAWAASHGLVGKLLVLYAGTIGLKHEAGLLLDLAHRFADREDTMIVVASEGLGAEYLRARPCANLRLLPFQPYDQLGDMLADATIAIATLNAAAGAFSVPSKITSYLAAGRPIVISAPAENLATRTVLAAGAGFGVAPHDGAAFAGAVGRLLDDEELRHRCAASGHAYARQTYDIGRIADRFEAFVEVRAGRS